MTTASRDIVVADPCAQTNPSLVVAALRAGALGVLDLNDLDPRTVTAAVADVARRTGAPFAVRLPWTGPGTRPGTGRATLDLPDLPDLPDQVDTVVVTGGPSGFAGLDPAGSNGVDGTRGPATGGLAALWPGRELLVEVTSRDEADSALAAGAHGLIAKGCESGGRVGDTEAFVLAQQIAGLGVPFWLQGGFGVRTAAAAFAAGAAGVVLDAHLALVRESSLGEGADTARWSSPANRRERRPQGWPPTNAARAASTVEARAAVAAMDGSETRVVGGHRFYVRPDLPAARLAADAPATDVAAQLGTDLHRDLLPLGQDAAVAAGLAEQHVTVAGVVQAVRAAVADQLAEAAARPPLAPGAGVATTNGTRYPVVQGPMTRVSDRAELAAAVADGGGLPFLALALLPGPEVRTLLTRTAELLGDRPWGVGVLGFVPADVRAAQLEVVHELRPPLALIAGGRPSQAQPLDEAGITTYLHVPSPGLLDRFLRDGARRFVFEGRECGGHVGPRASLPLWEAQIERLLGLDDAEVARLDVLFAGGIHDARSAAMVAAAAAPLTARGARIGVLMGTAYLFTEEAVGSGAITGTFQAMAQSCEATVLLETAPGHATRCVETDYVRAFAARKAELEAAGTPAEALWAELEALNLGRLRVASKGLARRGDTLVELDEAAQRRDGMYMIGQVATLRHERTTIADLHHEVTAGATRHLAERAAALAGPAGESANGAGAATTATSPATTAAGERPSRSVSGGRAGADRGDAAGGDGQTVAMPVAAGGGEAGRPLDVAVVGMAALFPGAADTEHFWANVVAGTDCVTEVPRARWDADTFYDPGSVTRDAGRKTPSRWGGFLPEVPFDALAYGIPPRSLAAIESVQLLSLEVAARALADAGYHRRSFDRSRAAVIFGAENGNDLGGAYGFRAAYPHYVGPLPPELEQHLPVPTEDSFPGVLTNVIAGRIANRLDLGGVNYTVDAACAASLAALDAACKELVTATSDLVLCGAADVHNSINDYLLFASVHALSPTGRCRTFDAGADGIALGEGVACVVLKRLADAERDGDRVYAVIEGVGGSSDGRHLGLTAPRKDGQRRAVERAHARAGIAPSAIGLIEAHGTGTVVGDRTELATLTEVFGTDPATAPGRTVLGSVKSQIGHTKCAAGLAGLVKAARAVHAGVLPPTRNINRPNDYYDGATSPFRFLNGPRPWPAGERRAGVSAFGFGGTNFHAVLRSHPDDTRPAHGVAVWPAELFLIRAATSDGADDRLAELQATVARVLADDPGGSCHRLRDLAWSVSSSGSDAPVQVAIVATDLADLAAKLVAAVAAEPCEGLFRADDLDPALRPSGPGQGARAPGVAAAGAPGPGGRRPVVAFLHPGQGSQRTGMVGDLLVAFPHLQAVLDGADPEWVDRMFPGTAFSAGERAAQAAALTDTRVAQPALGLAALAVTRLLRHLGVEPELVAGHSYGELVALHTAGVVDAPTLLGLSRARGEAMVAAAEALGDDPGAMAAVSLPAAELAPRLPEGVVLANHNGPRQVVVAGPTAAVEVFMASLAAEKVGVKRLDVAAAFHSPLVAQASLALARRLDEAEIGEASIPVWSNAGAAPYPTEPDEVRLTLAAQIGQPVRFVDQIEAMYAAGARVFVEAGPGRVLTQLVDRILGDRPHVAVACETPSEPGLTRLLLALAELAVAGVPVDVRPLFDGRADRIDLATLPVAAPGWRVDGHLVRTRDGEPVSGGLQPADRIPEVVMHHGGCSERAEAELAGAEPAGTERRETAAADLPAATGRDGNVLEYLRSMQQIVDAQRAVMLRYLGERSTAAGQAGSADTARPAALHDGVLGADAPLTALVGAEHVAGTNGSGHDVGPGPEAGNGGPVAWSFDALVPGTGSPGGLPAAPGEATGTTGPSGATGTITPAAPSPGQGAGGHGEAGDGGAGGTGTTGGPAGPGAASTPGSAGAPTPAALATGTAPEPSTLRPSGDELLATILAIVGERTGYPLEMLDPDLDLEADLSIDSIKRIEIIGELADQVGLPGADAGAGGPGIDETVVEELARLKTLRAIVTWIDTHADAPPPSATSPGTVDTFAPTATGSTGATGAGQPAPAARPAPLDPSTLPRAARREEGATAPAGTGPGAPRSSSAAGAVGVPGGGSDPAGPIDGTAGRLEPAVRPGGAGGGGHEARVARNVAAVAAQAAARPAQRAASAAGGGATGRGPRPGRRGGDQQPPPVPDAARRFVLETAMLAPALPVASAAGKTFAVVSDPWDGLGELRSRLERAGATVEVVPTHRGAPDRALPEPVASLLATVDGVVHLGAADPARPVDARDVFAALQPAIAGRATTLVAAVAPRRRVAGAVATGVPGLMRAVARELPQHHVRAVEVAADQAPGVVARLLADEVLDPAGPASVAYVDGTRTTRRVAKGTPLGTDLPRLPLDADSVVVLTGGARGITARAAIALARTTACRLELLGRSPRPAAEDPRTAAAADRPALRRALIAAGELAGPSEIEAACDRIMAARAIRSTLQTLSEIGVPTTYHAVDVRDGEALGRVLDEIRARHGRIDAIVHGAGVLDDRLARDKSHAGFDRVFATKVDAAGHLLARLADDVRLVVFFGSVSGVFGNRGQVDYSAANDALDELAARFDGVGERRVISIDWGPWGGTGMVSPELEREYARRGVGLVDPDEGVRALLAEMATLPGEPPQVVVMRAEPAALAVRPPIAPGTWTPLGAEVGADDEPEPGDGVVSGPGSAEHITLEDLTERG